MSEREVVDLDRRLGRKIQQLESLIEFGRVLAGSVDPGEVARRLGQTLAGQWALRACGVAAFRDGRPPLVWQKGLPALESIASSEPLRAALHGWRAPWFPSRESADEIDRLLAGAGVVAIAPLLSGETPVGVATLGARPEGLAFDEDDLAYAFGLCRQAVIALELAWQSQEASRWKQINEAGEEWRSLDRVSRLVFVGVARLGYDQPLDETSFARSFAVLLGECGMSLGPERVTATLDRLIATGAIARDSNGLLRIAKEAWLAIPETRKPIAELAGRANERIGAYEIVERIGGGGMGDVFRASNVHDGSAAAVKLLTAFDSANTEARRRLEREGALVASLAHPNIVRLFERGEHEGRLYIAMELVDGETLWKRVRRGALPLADALRAATELASALAALHARGIVHRDVKSSNVMITTTGRLVLLDFGLARDLGGTTLTQQNQIMGTLPYMAPEQLQGETCNAAADVWAWGIVVYEMLTGGLPWKARDTVRLAVEILSGVANVHAAIRDRVGEPFARLLDDVFELDPGQRIPDAARLLGRLALVEGLPELPIPARTEEMPFEPEVPATRIEPTSIDGANRDE